MTKKGKAGSAPGSERARARDTYGKVSQLLPRLTYHVGGQADLTVVDIRLVEKGPFNWMAILKAEDSAGLTWVLFSSAGDMVSLLMGIETALVAGNWRVDVPWKPKGGEEEG